MKISLASVPFWHMLFDSKYFKTLYLLTLNYVSLLDRYPYIYNRDGTELHCLKVGILAPCLLLSLQYTGLNS